MDYDLLACLADAAAAAPSVMGKVGILQRQALERTAAGQAAPLCEPQPGTRRHLSSARVSPSPQAELDAAALGANHVEREVSVICNGTLGTFLIPSQTVECHCSRCTAATTTGATAGGAQGAGGQQLPAITPTEFERHSGLLTAKKWRNSIRLVQGDGTITIGKWLEQHNILPRPKCSGGALGSPLTGGSGCGAAATGYGGFQQLAPDGHGHGHPMGPSCNDSQAGATGGGLGGLRACGGPQAHQQQATPALRCTLPASRYPASEYITGEDDEYDEPGAHLAGADDHGYDAYAAILGDGDGADDEDYEDGQYLDTADGHGGAHPGRGGRRAPAFRNSRSVNGSQRFERRGSGRGGGGRQAGHGIGRALLSRQRARYTGRGVPEGIGARASGSGNGIGCGLGPQSRGPGSGGSGAIDPRRGVGRGGGASSGEDGGGGGGGKQDHSSSEGSPPSDDSKRRDGSGGSGEGDGSGTGDVGDSRRPLPPGGQGERQHDDGVDPSGARRAHRNQPGCKPQQHTACEGSADVGAAQERGRHAAAVKRLPPEYLTGPDIGPALKRGRTRPSAAGGSGGAGGGGGATGNEMAALYDMAAASLPQVRGWRFLGPEAGPAADQVLVSVTINGRAYAGLLAPQHLMPPVPSRPPPTAPPAANGACHGRKSGLGRAAAEGPCGSRGRAGRLADPLTATTVPASADAAALDGNHPHPNHPHPNHDSAQPNASTPVPLPDDEPLDDGMPLDCPRCALCRRVAVPLLAAPPPPPPKLTALPSGTAPALSSPSAAPANAAGASASAFKDGLEATADAPNAETTSASATATAAADAKGEAAAAMPPLPLIPLPRPLDASRSHGSVLGMGQCPDTVGRAAVIVVKSCTAEEAGAVVSGGDETHSISVLPEAEAGAAEAGQQAAPATSLKPSRSSPPASQAVDNGSGSGQGFSGCTTTTFAAATAATAVSKVAPAPAPAPAAAHAAVRGPTEDYFSRRVNAEAEGIEAHSEQPLGIVKTEGIEAHSEQPLGIVKTELSAPAEVAAARAGSLLPAAPAASPCREASRTQRQTGCGLGPLVEVKGGSADAGGGVPVSMSVHSQCALWSPDVFVIGGALYGVPAVIKLGRSRRCAHCGRSGATLSCCSAKCHQVYHLPCALEAGAMLVAEPYSMACPDHRSSLTASAHPTSSCQPQGRLHASRLRPAQSQDASLSTTTTTATAGGTPAGAKSAQPHAPQPPQQVALPRSLQMSAGRRVVLPPVGALPLPSAVQSGCAVEPVAGGPTRPLRPGCEGSGAGGSSLPALMMLRSQADGGGAVVASGLPPPPPPLPSSSCMPPPRATAAAAAVPTAQAAPCCPEGGSVVEREEAETICGNRKRSGGPDGGVAASNVNTAAEAEALGPSGAKRHRAGGEGTIRQSGEEGSGGVQEGAASAVLGLGPSGAWHIFERRQAAATVAAASGSGGIGAAAALHAAAALSGLYGTAVPAGMSSGQLEMSAASDGTMAVNSQGPGQAAGGGGGGTKRRREGAEGVSNTAAATAAAVRAGEAGDGDGGGEEGAAPEGAAPQSPHRLHHPAGVQGGLSLSSSLGLGSMPLVGMMGMGVSMPSMFLSRGAVAAGVASDSDPELRGLGDYRLTHAAALSLLQQQQSGGAGGIAEGVAMLLGQGQKTGSGGGGERSVGSPMVNHPPIPRGMPGGGGRPRHHHHHQHQQQAVPGTSASTASASTGTVYGGRTAGGDASLPTRNAGGAGDESSEHPGQQGLSAMQLLQQQHPGMMHVLPRAARNIEGLLPSRPLLHNPYVPSSGDPSADLALSKMAQAGSREVEAELLGGTTGRAGHTGRCAVCVIQRKGKCGTESAPKKCLRRQLVALQRATGGGGAGSVGADDCDEPPFSDIDPAVGPFMDERVAAAAAQQRARERERRETWSLPLGQGSGATGKRQPQHYAAV